MAALHSAPYWISIRKSTIEGAGLGAFTHINLKPNIQFGPYLGNLQDDLNDPEDALYSYEVIMSKTNFSSFVLSPF